MYFSYKRDLELFIKKVVKINPENRILFRMDIDDLFTSFKERNGIKWYTIFDQRLKLEWKLYGYNSCMNRFDVMDDRSYKSFIKTHDFVKSVGWCSNVPILQNGK